MLLQFPLLSLSHFFQFEEASYVVVCQTKQFPHFCDVYNSFPYYHSPRIVNYRIISLKKLNKIC